MATDTIDNPTLWQARATAWELMALTFRYPDDVLTGAVATGEWADAADELAEVLGLELPENFSEGLPAPAPTADDADDGAEPTEAELDELLHRLRAEATRLFVGAPEPIVSPYEGVWRATDEGVQPLLFVNPHSMDVERFMKSCGLGRPEGTNEPLDHIAAECELLQYLAAFAAGASAPAEAPVATDLPGGSPEAAFNQFLVEHGFTWMPRFAEKAATETREPLFRAASAFLVALAR